MVLKLAASERFWNRFYIYTVLKNLSVIHLWLFFHRNYLNFSSCPSFWSQHRIYLLLFTAAGHQGMKHTHTHFTPFNFTSHFQLVIMMQFYFLFSFSRFMVYCSRSILLWWHILHFIKQTAPWNSNIFEVCVRFYLSQLQECSCSTYWQLNVLKMCQI